MFKVPYNQNQRKAVLQTLVLQKHSWLCQFKLCNLVGMCVKLEQSPAWITAFHSTWDFFSEQMLAITEVLVPVSLKIFTEFTFCPTDFLIGNYSITEQFYMAHMVV